MTLFIAYSNSPYFTKDDMGYKGADICLRPPNF